ncbi:MAG TPA: carboxypeptidase-like regulatory domain-containing protein [Asanoa sp.]
MEITSLSSGTLDPGQSAELKYKVTNVNQGGTASTNISVTSTIPEVSCQGDCDLTRSIAPGESMEFTAQLKAGQIPAGQNKTGQVKVEAKISNDTGTAQRAITIRAPQPQVQTVKEIAGKVTNQTNGDPVPNAYVALSDSGNHRYQTFSNSSGNYRFLGTTERPITPGTIQIGAQKDDQSITRQITVGAGKSLTDVRLAIKLPVAEVTPTPTTAASLPADTVPTEALPTDSAAPEAPVNASDSSGGGMGSWLVVLGGGLLVALGVGGIVWVLMRRKGADGDDDVTGLRPPVPVGGGGYGAPGDPTRMVPRAVAGDGLADAPTMLQNRAAADEFPDPYGAAVPASQPPGYGPPQNWADQGYGGQPTQQYGGEGGYGAPGAAYGAPTQSYGNAPGSGGGYGAQGYDQPTGRYEPGGGYGQQPYESGPYRPGGYAGGGEPQPYGPVDGYEQDAYGQRSNGYDQGYAGGQGYDQGGGYGGQQGGYEQGGYGGYDQAGGYGQPGYDQGGYPPQGGYGDRVPEQRGGYDQGGYHPEEPQQDTGRARHGAKQNGRGDRRSLDWLDD